jgi:hypothetical protein
MGLLHSQWYPAVSDAPFFHPKSICLFNLVPIGLFLYLFFTACKKPVDKGDQPPFTASPTAVMVTAGVLTEISGIADSYKNEGCLWGEQDSGHPSDLYLLKHDGSYIKSIHLEGASNRDWEDMTIGNGPGSGKYVYVADIGDNNAVFHVYFIYRLPEPGRETDTVSSFDKINFQYTDGSHDAEAMLVDNNTRDIYIITKREAASVVYKISYPQSVSGVNVAAPLDTLPLTGVVSAAFSPDQKELIIKTYTRLYYWKKKQNESLPELLQSAPVILDYQMEPQGEAVSFKKDNSGFFTLSEKALSSSVLLYFYKRN